MLYFFLFLLLPAFAESQEFEVDKEGIEKSAKSEYEKLEEFSENGWDSDDLVFAPSDEHTEDDKIIIGALRLLQNHTYPNDHGVRGQSLRNARMHVQDGGGGLPPIGGPGMSPPPRLSMIGGCGH